MGLAGPVFRKQIEKKTLGHISLRKTTAWNGDSRVYTILPIDGLREALLSSHSRASAFSLTPLEPP